MKSLISYAVRVASQRQTARNLLFTPVKFTESTLGRLFQAVELYILLLFVLISAFYKMPVRSSVVAELVRRRLTAMGVRDEESGPGKDNRTSQFSMIQAPYQLPPIETMRSLQSSNRISFSQRISNGFSAMNSKFTNRRLGSSQNVGQAIGGADEGDQRRLWDRFFSETRCIAGCACVFCGMRSDRSVSAASISFESS